jgi:hypothetical protein
MKIQNLSIIALALLCCLGFQTALAAGECNASLFAGGTDDTGDSAKPYEISTPAQLQNLNKCLGESYHYVLTNNIDLSEIDWQPIGQNSSHPFSGKLDGKSYKVLGFKINKLLDEAVGLFGYVSSRAELNNIRVEIDGEVRGFDYVGGLVGKNWGKITNSYVTGKVSGKKNVGLIAGYNYGTISSSYANGNVFGNTHIGSLAGYNEGTIIDCYATATVLGNNYVGGLAGHNKSTVKNSYFVGSVTPVTATCALVNGKPVVTCYPTELVVSEADFTGLPNAESPAGPYAISASRVVCGEITPRNLPNCGTITVEASSSSEEASSSSVTPTCAYQASWCGNTVLTNTTAKPKEGQCVFVKDYTALTTAGGGGTVLINGTTCKGSRTDCVAIKPSASDGGYYIYVQIEGLSTSLDYTVTAGTPNCEHRFIPIMLGLNPGKTTSELNFNWYSGTGTDKSFVRLLKNNDSIYFTGTSGTASTGYRYHKATVTGLEPSTKYTYWVSNDSTEWSQEYTFKTPTTDGNFKFAAIADVQIAAYSSSSVLADTIARW